MATTENFKNFKNCFGGKFRVGIASQQRPNAQSFLDRFYALVIVYLLANKALVQQGRRLESETLQEIFEEMIANSFGHVAK